MGFFGNNGVGKTNLLDGIYYLCFTKSCFSKSEQQNVHTGSSGFRLEGHFELSHDPQHVVCVLRGAGKKEFSVGGELYEKNSLHIGRFPCVIIAPDDVQIITGGSEERRRYVDVLLCQLDPVYLQNLIIYNKLLLQRTGLLKLFSERRHFDFKLLDVYDAQLLEPGRYIFDRRKSFLEKLLPEVSIFYEKIAGSLEGIGLSYDSQLLNNSFEHLMLQYREKDLLLQRSNAGVHKDDIEITIDGQSFKYMASQGQRKSLLFALKLAEYETLKSAKGFAPLLLLDDVFEKLDADRMHQLLHWVCVQNSGQIFITDTHQERIREHLDQLGVSFQLIGLE